VRASRIPFSRRHDCRCRRLGTGEAEGGAGVSGLGAIVLGLGDGGEGNGAVGGAGEERVGGFR